MYVLLCAYVIINGLVSDTWCYINAGIAIVILNRIEMNMTISCPPHPCKCDTDLRHRALCDLSVVSAPGREERYFHVNQHYFVSKYCLHI